MEDWKLKTTPVVKLKTMNKRFAISFVSLSMRREHCSLLSTTDICYWAGSISPTLAGPVAFQGRLKL